MCHFTFYNFCIHANFSVGAIVKGAMEFLKKYCLFTFFSLLENRDGHLAGLMEAKPEVLRKIYPHRKDVPFYVLQFCIYANFLSGKSLRRYKIFKK